MLAKLQSLGHHIDKRELRELADKGLRAITRMHNIHAKAQEQFGQAICALETTVSAFSFGFARGYWSKPGQDVTVMGVPIDLGAGLIGHAMGFFGSLGHYAEDAHNLSNGALASYATTLGLRMGVEQAQKHAGVTPAAQGWGGGRPMTPDELARMVASAGI